LNKNPEEKMPKERERERDVAMRIVLFILFIATCVSRRSIYDRRAAAEKQSTDYYYKQAQFPHSWLFCVYCSFLHGHRKVINHVDLQVKISLQRKFSLKGWKNFRYFEIRNLRKIAKISWNKKSPNSLLEVKYNPYIVFDMSSSWKGADKLLTEWRLLRHL
jgi:hypothetical protein